jgi:hypothetical protein
MSDTVWQALIAAVVTIVLGWLQQRTKNSVDAGNSNAGKIASAAAGKAAQVAIKQDVADRKVDEVKDALAENTAVTNVIHKLVNNEMHLALSSNADLARWKADRSGLPEDAVAAKNAEEKLQKHDDKQADVDRGKP